MTYLQRVMLRFGAVLFVALLAGLAASSWLALKAFERELVPEIENKAVTLGRSVAGLLGRAVSYGMAVDELVGVKDMFDGVIAANPEIGLLAVTGNGGALLHASGRLDAALKAHLAGSSESVPPAEGDGARPVVQRVSGLYLVRLPITVDGQREGMLHVGARADYVQKVLEETLLDVLVVLVVAFLIAAEFMYFFASRGAALQLSGLMNTLEAGAAGRFDLPLTARAERALGPLAVGINATLARVNAAHQQLVQDGAAAWARRRHGARQALREALRGWRGLARYRFGAIAPDLSVARLGLVRAPLFLFFFAEDLSRSFIPLYAAEIFTPVPGLSMKFVLSLPIMLFMLVVGLSQPLLGAWSERIGPRQALIAGALMGVVAHLGAAFAFTLYDFLLWRSLAGVAWGIMFVAGQGYVLDHTTAHTRTRGLAFFVGVIMVSSACGPSIGGILADGIGYRATLTLAAVLAACAGALAWSQLPRQRSIAVERKARASDFAALLANRRFVLFLLTAAMPAKIILIGFCFYLVPLYVPELGGSAAMVGRLIMLYAIVMVVGVPIAARWSGRPDRRWRFVVAGLLLSGVAGMLPLLLPGIYAVAAMVVLLGVAQSMSIAPQTAMVQDICQREVDRLGAGAVFGVYRLIERIGNALGPVVAAALLQGLPFSQVFAAIGALMLVAGIVFALTFRRSDAAATLPAKAGASA